MSRYAHLYVTERAALTATDQKLRAVYRSEGADYPLYSALDAVLRHLSEELKTYEDFGGSSDPVDEAILREVAKIQELIAKELGQ